MATAITNLVVKDSTAWTEEQLRTQVDNLDRLLTGGYQIVASHTVSSGPQTVIVFVLHRPDRIENDSDAEDPK